MTVWIIAGQQRYVHTYSIFIRLFLKTLYEIVLVVSQVLYISSSAKVCMHVAGECLGKLYALAS